MMIYKSLNQLENDKRQSSDKYNSLAVSFEEYKTEQTTSYEREQNMKAWQKSGKQNG